MLRCLIVEDQLMFLELLQRLLHSQRGLQVIATATTRSQAMAACRLHRPDLLILDLGLVDGDGLPVLEALAQWSPHSRAVVLSAQAAGFVCPRHLQPLLLGVVDKGATFDTLIDVISPLMAPAQAAAAPLPLTPRQELILALIGQGLSNKAIARQLELSVTTVETHRKGIARRLGCSGAELVRQATLLHAQP